MERQSFKFIPRDSSSTMFRGLDDIEKEEDAEYDYEYDDEDPEVEEI